MSENTPTLADRVARLNGEYRQWVDAEWGRWIAGRQERFVQPAWSGVRELCPAYQRGGQWRRHITPLADAWWRERGFRLHWPDDDRDPCKIELLDATHA